MHQVHVTLAAIPLAGASTEPPTAFLIWKFGKVETSKGTFLFDEKAATAVMADYRLHGNRLTFDYEHKATDPASRAGDGKAAGSFLLELRPDGLYAADCRWTPAAQRGLRDREWLYHSPTFEVEEKTNRILNVINVALTNVPATRNLRPLVAASHHPSRTSPMATTAKKTVSTDTQAPPGEDDDALARAYAAKFKSSRDRMAKAKAEFDVATAEHEHIAGFARDAVPAEAPADDAEEEVAAAVVDPADTTEVTVPDGKQRCPSCKHIVDAGLTKCPDCGADLPKDDAAPPADKKAPPFGTAALGKDAPPSVPVTASADAAIARVACEVTGHTHPSEVAGALRALKAQADQTTALASTNVSLGTELRGHQVRAQVDAAVRSLKLEPKKKQWALDMGMRDPKELASFLATCTTPVAPTEQMRRVADPRVQQVTLSKMEADMAQRLGVKPEDFLAQKTANEARGRMAAASSTADDDD